MVFLILIGAAIFSLVFRGFGGEELVGQFFMELPGGVVSATILVMVIFLLGFVLDFIEITFVVVPSGAGVAGNGPGSGLAWDYDCHQPADLVFDSALWFCPVLSSRRGAVLCRYFGYVPRRNALYCYPIAADVDAVDLAVLATWLRCYLQLIVGHKGWLRQ